MGLETFSILIISLVLDNQLVWLQFHRPFSYTPRHQKAYLRISKMWSGDWIERNVSNNTLSNANTDQ